MNEDRLAAKAITLVVIIVIALIAIFGFVYSVPEGHVGVLFNKAGSNPGFDYEEKPQGIHFKTPFFQYVTDMNFRTQTLEMRGDMAVTPKDLNGINFRQELVLRYRLSADQAAEFLEQKGKDTDAVVFTALRGVARNVLGKYNQEEVPELRAQIADEILVQLQDRLDSEISGQLKPGYILIEAVDVRNTEFNDQIEDAINKKQVRKQEAEKQEYNLQIAEKEREIQIVNADAVRQAQVLKAEGEAEAILKVATAKAEGIQKVNDAYQGMPMQYVSTKWAESIQTNDKVIFGLDSIGSNTLPFMNINDLMAASYATGNTKSTAVAGGGSS